MSTGIDFIVGEKIAKASSQKRKKFFLLMSLVANLSILGFFKYFNFFIESANVVFGELGLNLTSLNIILPVGISFYTFQTMSYTIDIYRGSLKPSKSLLNFAIFVGFFPQLVAGPIVRAREFLPQLKKKIAIRRENIEVGLQIFVFGAFKKIIIADRLAFFVDEVFANPSLYDSATIWLGVVAYAIQIFCDFSGYSDMAIGIARILGLHLPKNFNMPYIAQNITEFWRRWHISLSSWLKDYLYIPLGGNRKGKFRTYVNLAITMLLGGLWHGASWNFVFWGAWHGVGLAVHKWLFSTKDNKKTSFNFVSWAITTLFVLVGWVFFRADSTEKTLIMLKRMFFAWETFAIHWIYLPLYIIIPLVIVAYIIGRKWFQDDYPLVNLRSFFGMFIFLFVVVGIVLFYFHNPQPFIYFQF